ncbi:MAG: histidine kinase dimerization/phosphoacceptor domain -containing protein [Pseudomonadota bacterium]
MGKANVLSIDRLRKSLQSLSARIILLMTLALFPLGLISIYQTRAVIGEAQELTNAALTSQTIAAAAAERELIQEAVGAAAGLAASIAGGVSDCPALLREFVSGSNSYIFAGYTERDGIMRCSSTGDVVDFSDEPGLADALALDGPTISMNTEGRVSRQSVVLVSHAARAGGEALGLVTLSIPHWIANPLLEDAEAGQDGLRLASVNSAGTIISSSGPLEGASDFLPADIPLDEVFARKGGTFSARAADGSFRFYTVSRMIEDQLALVGSWPAAASSLGAISSAQAWAIGFPVLMWFAGVGVAYFGLQRLVVRHIKRLRSSMRRFALGDREDAFLELIDAPEELEEAERAFNRMAVIITEAENRQLKDLRDKEVLLKEVHHRVKNNLQLIASIINMQAREAKQGETRRMLSNLQRRVRGLAMLHRSLYTTPDETQVNSADLVEMVVADTSALAREQEIEVSSQLSAAPLFPDQAVPFSMLVSEAMTNAFKHHGKSAEGKAFIDVQLTTSGRDLRLTVANSVAPPGQKSELPDDGVLSSDGLGRRLMTAFVSQLEGEQSVEETPDRYALNITIPLRNFEAAE